jgi:hypothetical protein
MSLAVWVSSTL